jgi:hypothetical protein
MAKPRSVEKDLVETKRSESCQPIAAIAWHDAERGDFQRKKFESGAVFKHLYPRACQLSLSMKQMRKLR